MNWRDNALFASNDKFKNTIFCQNVTFAVELEKNTFKNIYVLFGSTRLSQKLKSMLFEIFSLLQLSRYTPFGIYFSLLKTFFGEKWFHEYFAYFPFPSK